MPDRNAVLQAVYDPANNWLNVESVGSASGSTVGIPDENAIWHNVFDKATNTLRVVFV
jgi:hypothetical protein